MLDNDLFQITIFMFLGISAISDFWIHWNTGFVFWTVLFITAYRFISVYGLTYLLNKGRLEPIGKGTRENLFYVLYFSFS